VWGTKQKSENFEDGRDSSGIFVDVLYLGI